MTIEEIQLKQNQYFKSGITRQYSFRKQKLIELEKEIIAQEKEIAHALYCDLRKSESEAYISEISFVLSELRYIRKHLYSWCKPKKVHTPIYCGCAKSFCVSEPYGLALVIAPWNYPFLLSFIPLIGALAAGNCCTIKPSEFAPKTSSIIYNICKNIFNEEYVAVVEGDSNISAHLLDCRWDYIFFTGSQRIAKIVMKQAAQYVTPLSLELGGKSPCIVDSTANLAIATKRIAWGKFLNAGQTCVAPDYILVEKSIKDSFIAEMKRSILALYGEDIQKSIDYSRIINLNHFNRLMKLRDSGQIVYGGKYDASDLYIEPTLLDSVSVDSPIMQEEIFGPLLPILTFDAWEEVIPFLQNREKPLALYLFSTSKHHQKEIVKNVSFGGGCINDTIFHLSTHFLPFGGVGNSGFGMCHGKYSFDTFSHIKSIFKQSSKIDFFLRYPPYQKTISLLRKLLS